MKKPDGAKSDDGAGVGYKRPPAEHRFKKGVSGNPSGRPKRKVAKRAQPVTAPSLEDIVMREAFRTITIRENDKPVEMPMIQVVIRSLGVSAVKGNFRAQIAVADMVRSLDDRALKHQAALYETVARYKEECQATFAECDRQGIPRPDLVPHPDDIVLDARTASVFENGPLDEKEKADWDELFERRDTLLEEIADLEEAMKGELSPSLRLSLEDAIRHNQKFIDMVNRLFPSPEVRRKPNFDIREWREKQRRFQDFQKSTRVRRMTARGGGQTE